MGKEKIKEILHELDIATRKLVAGLQLTKKALEEIKEIGVKFLEEIEKDENIWN